MIKIVNIKIRAGVNVFGGSIMPLVSSNNTMYLYGRYVPCIVWKDFDDVDFYPCAVQSNN